MIFSKREILKLIAKKANYLINLNHITAIINIFIDEFINYLIINEEIKVPNFGTFRCGKRNSKKFFNVKSNNFQYSNGNYVLSFVLDEKIQKLILK